MVREEFAAGMTLQEDALLDRTHYTKYFRRLRALIAVEAGSRFCEHMQGSSDYVAII